VCRLRGGQYRPSATCSCASISDSARRMRSLQQGPADVARRVIGCHLTREMRFKVRLDDVVGNISQAPPWGT
jgi:hypothetical protein